MDLRKHTRSMTRDTGLLDIYPCHDVVTVHADQSVTVYDTENNNKQKFQSIHSFQADTQLNNEDFKLMYYTEHDLSSLTFIKSADPTVIKVLVAEH